MKHMQHNLLGRSPWTLLQLLLTLTALAGVTQSAPQALTGLYQFGGSLPPPPAGLGYRKISGSLANIALRTDDTLSFSTGTTSSFVDPRGTRGFHYIEADGDTYNYFALRSDGTIVAWTNNTTLQAIPPLPPGMSYTSISVGADYVLALRSDGQVIGWGTNTSGQLNVPALPSGQTWRKISAGNYHAAGIRSDGQLVVWGSPASGGGTVPTLPPGITWIDVSAGGGNTVALRSDGVAIYLNIPLTLVPAQGSRYLLPEAGRTGSTSMFYALTQSNGTVSVYSIDAPAPEPGKRWVGAYVPSAEAFPAPNFYTLIWMLADCDANGVDDRTQVNSPGEDCNANRVPDACDLKLGARDCDFNGVLDECEIAVLPDCNENLESDFCDIANLSSSDVNTDGIPDECASDCNGNGTPDLVELHRGSPDCDSNGVPDYCDPDVNTDGVVDACQDGGTTYCFGAPSTCPCGNNGAATSGCANSQSPAGASLTAEGLPSRIADSLSLVGRGMPAVSSVLYFQGTSPATGTPYGDGLRCVTGLVIRLGYTFNAGGESAWPQAGAAPIHVGGAIPATGAATRHYQAWYRDVAAGYCTPNRFNLTNGVSVVWVP